jgi:hypothetical protein
MNSVTRKQSFSKVKTIFFPFFDRMVGSESTGDYNLEIQDIRDNTLEISAILHYLEFRIGIVYY